MTEEKNAVSRANALSVASLILGILSIPLSLIFIGIVFAGLAVTLALLSRGDQRMSGTAIAGLVCGLVGIGLLMLICVAAFLFAGTVGVM